MNTDQVNHEITKPRRGIRRSTIASCLSVFVVLHFAFCFLANPTFAQTAPTTAPLGSAAEYYRQVNQPDEIVSVLRNGLTVIIKRVPSPVVSVRGYVKTGGIYEGKWLGGGLSHLLEHLVAGGSTKNRTEAENRELLQKIGNNSNAYTSYDHTAYFINTTPQHMEQAVDLLSGWLFGALITPQEYAREYEVVQRELEKGKGEPGRQFYYMEAMNRYRVSPARVPVIGYQEVIQGLSRDDVYDYYKLAYQPSNMVFCLAGDLPPEQMLQAVQKYVDGVGQGRAFVHEIPAEPGVYAPRALVATFPKLGQAIYQLAFPTISLDNPDLYALDLLSAVLSWGESSLLVEDIRDKQQLVSSISSSSYTPDYVDGSFAIQMQLDPSKVPAATQAVMDLIEQIKVGGIPQDRIDRAKTQVKVAHVRSRQTAEAIASAMATDYLSTGDPHFSDRYTEEIQKVTADQLRDVARKYLDPNKLLTTALLPAEWVGSAGLPRAEDLIRPTAPTTRPAVEAESQVVKVQLENNTTLLVKRITTSPLVSIQMYALGGLTAEEAQNNGIGNLTMEMAMRGTTTRSAQQIAEFFDSIGGDMSTACGNNTWYWTASCLRDDFEKAMSVYADVVNNASFPASELPPVKQRILAAIESQDADWTAQAFRYFKQQYYGPQNSPYQFLTIGTKDNVEQFAPEQLAQWYHDRVRSAPRVLAIYGDVEIDQAKRLAQTLLGTGKKLPQIEPRSFPAATQPSLSSASQQPAPPSSPQVEVRSVEVQKTQQPLAGIVIGYDADSVIGSPANFPLIVGDTMSSGYGYPTGYLHEILRGRGLVYIVHAQNSPGRNKDLPGTFLVYAGCDPSKVNEVIDLILENIARLQGTAQDMQPDWFARSKQLIVTSDAMDNETPAEQATTAALDELYGMGYNYHDRFADDINAVQLDDVRQVARARLSRCMVTVSTPAPDRVKTQTGTRQYRTFPPVDLTPQGVQHDAPAGPS